MTAPTTAHRYRVHRRHPLEVLSDRLADALDKYPDLFDGRLRDCVGQLRAVLDEAVDERTSR